VALIRVENDQSGDILMKNSVFLRRPPKSLPSLSLPVKFVHNVRARDKRNATIRLRSNRLALYVVLSTAANGHFSDNVFHLRPNQVVDVDFEASSDCEAVTWTSFGGHCESSTFVVITVRVVASTTTLLMISSDHHNGRRHCRGYSLRQQ
jgi:Ig-fold domain